MTAPATILDGPLGTEARHTFNGFTIMDLSVLKDHTALPYAVADKITGLHDLSDAADPRDNLTGQIGEIAYPSLRRGKTAVYNGRIVARSLQELRQVQAALRAALASTSDTALTITPHPSVGGVTLTGFGRPMACPMDDEQVLDDNSVPTPWQRFFVLSFRLRDPRFFDLADAVTGGATSDSTAALVMSGTAPAEPVFAIAAPGGVVTLQHMGLPRTLAFRSDLPAGALVVDFLNRIARIGTRDVTGFINWALSDWWDEGIPGVLPGVSNTLKVTGGTWTVSAIPAVW